MRAPLLQRHLPLWASLTIVGIAASIVGLLLLLRIGRDLFTWVGFDAVRTTMSGLELALRLAALSALTSYLYFKYRQRERAQAKEESAALTAKGIDVDPLKPAVEKARRSFVSRRPPAWGVCFHRGLLGLTRRAVLHLPYFRDKQTETQAHTKGA